MTTATLTRGQKAALRRQEEKQQFLKEWMALKPKWAERAGLVLDYFLTKNPQYYEIRVLTPGLSACPEVVCMSFEDKENNWDTYVLCLSFPGEHLEPSLSGLALSQPLEALEARMAEIEAQKAEELRKESVRKDALRKVKEILNQEELELLRIRG